MKRHVDAEINTNYRMQHLRKRKEAQQKFDCANQWNDLIIIKTTNTKKCPVMTLMADI